MRFVCENVNRKDCLWILRFSFPFAQRPHLLKWLVLYCFVRDLSENSFHCNLIMESKHLLFDWFLWWISQRSSNLLRLKDVSCLFWGYVALRQASVTEHWNKVEWTHFEWILMILTFLALNSTQWLNINSNFRVCFLSLSQQQKNFYDRDSISRFYDV